jgi:DNA polymerase elongation subunit (family B)
MEVISIEEIGTEEIVYDLETEAGTFVAGGLEHGILVKNTDSCYVRFPIHKSDYKHHGDKQEEEFMKDNFKMAQKCANYCTSQFKPPIELAFEKYMYPLVLFAKKRYAYKEWTDPNFPKNPIPNPIADDEIHYKGLQLVRRDTCRYVKEELNHIFEIIMNQKSKEDAKNAALPYIQRSIKNLLDGNIDFNKLVLSKQLKARYVVRKNKISNTYHWTNSEISQPHVRLAQQLMIRNPANHPAPPDRVPYLFIEKKGNNLLQCDKVIHPEDFDQSKHKIDSLYYFDHQYQKPIDMVFQFMVLDRKGNPDTTKIYKSMRISAVNKINGQPEASAFFKPKSKDSANSKKLFEFKPDFIEYAGSDNEVDEVDDKDTDPDAVDLSEDLF